MTEDELIEKLRALAKHRGWEPIECRIMSREQLRMAIRDREGAYRTYAIALGRRQKTPAETRQRLFDEMAPLLAAEKYSIVDDYVFCSCQPFEPDREIPAGLPDPECSECDGTGRRVWGL